MYVSSHGLINWISNNGIPRPKVGIKEILGKSPILTGIVPINGWRTNKLVGTVAQEQL